MYFLHQDISRRAKCYNLTRYKNQNGKWVELRKNKMPRGNVWRRLMDCEWQALAVRTDSAVRICKLILADIDPPKPV